jgi:hypothetical protein
MLEIPQDLASPLEAHDAFAPGKLIPGIHNPIVAEIDRIAAEAGITPGDVTGASYAITAFEKEYLTGFRRTHKTGALGIIYVGQHAPAVADRCRSICGALLRNFITARLIVREELVTELFEHRRQPSADLVAVPDFAYRDAPAATRRALSSWLMGRIARGRQTVLGLPDKSGITDIFGAEASLYMAHFAVHHGVPLPA